MPTNRLTKTYVIKDIRNNVYYAGLLLGFHNFVSDKARAKCLTKIQAKPFVGHPYYEIQEAS